MGDAMHQLDSFDFEASWRGTFGDLPPLGWVLRERLPECWTRFHALPGSKRYADTPGERAVIIRRANALAVECFGDRRDVWVIAALHGDRPAGSAALVDRLRMASSITWSDPSELFEDQVQWEFFAAGLKWSKGTLDWMFGDISEDRASALMFSQELQTVLAPYDGGFDIVCPQVEKLRDLETRYKDWMSDRADKL